jgi:hypothetical protein
VNALYIKILLSKIDRQSLNLFSRCRSYSYILKIFSVHELVFAYMISQTFKMILLDLGLVTSCNSGSKLVIMSLRSK